jgi:hypothetical protein
MPNTYYVVSSRVRVGVINSVKSADFEDRTDELRAYKKFEYEDVIRLINSDSNFKVFGTYAAARKYGIENIVTENKEPDLNVNLGSAVRSFFSPAYAILNVANTVREIVAPDKQKVIYQNMILKVTMLNNSKIQTVLNNADGSLGSINRMAFYSSPYNAANDYVHDQRFSSDNSLLFHWIQHANRHWSVKLSRPLPKSYSRLTQSSPTTVTKASALIQDYFKPKHGLFWTGHWNRHHLAAAKELYTALQNCDEQTAFELIVAKRNSLSHSAKQDGSFFRRLTAAVEMLALVDDRPPAPQPR